VGEQRHGEPVRLPPGRHSLPRELVRSNQEERLIEAAGRALAGRSYAELSVSDITEEAGVSRATFYQLFEGKRECVLAAHMRAGENLAGRIEKACEGLDVWEDRVAAGVREALRFADESPQEARLLILHTLGADPELSERVLEAHGRLVELMQRGRTEPAAEEVLSGLLVRGLVGGITSIVAEQLTSGNTHQLRELEPHLVELMLVAYRDPPPA
jgi:AcrR family transcriptional regulator